LKQTENLQQWRALLRVAHQLLLIYAKINFNKSFLMKTAEFELVSLALAQLAHPVNLHSTDTDGDIDTPVTASRISVGCLVACRVAFAIS